MKKLSLIVALLMMSLVAFAQVPQSYKQGQTSFTAGMGLASTLGGTPLFLAAEYGWDAQYGIGASYTRQTYKSGWWDYTWNYVGLGVVYHYDFLKMANVDSYGRAGIGFIFGSATGGFAGLTAPSVSGFGYDAAAGLTYYFTSNLGANAEVGYGISLLKVGVTYKL